VAVRQAKRQQDDSRHEECQRQLGEPVSMELPTAESPRKKGRRHKNTSSGTEIRAIINANTRTITSMGTFLQSAIAGGSQRTSRVDRDFQSVTHLGLGAINRVSRQLQDASRFERDSRDAKGTEVLLDVDDRGILAEGLLARRFGHRLCDCAQGNLFFGNHCFGFTYIQLVD
jgi:hypothetical protein